MTSLSHTFSFVPSDLFLFWKNLHINPKHGFILGSGAGTPNDSVVYMSIEEPVRVFESNNNVLIRIKNELNKSAHESFPRFVGFLGFEAGRHFDSGIQKIKFKKESLKMPTMSFAEYESVLKLDFLKNETTVFTVGKGARRKLSKLLKKIQEASEKQFPSLQGRVRVGYKWIPSSFKTTEEETINTHPWPLPGGKGIINSFGFLDFESFRPLVKKAKEKITEGDIYQANLSFRFTRRFKGDPLTLYKELCRRNPSPYACLIKNKESWVVSCSPELLLEVEGSHISTRPIAGTRPRSGSKKQDQARRGQLLLSPKERAEHIMLVDLERNDLGRVCKSGSVKVTDRYAVEAYSHVMHIVSQVEGKLEKRKTAIDALKSLFPGGTITGCPKIRSIQIISDLEKEARGPFYGSAGYFCANGDAKFNILIRTALVKNKKIFVQAGAGIVADSNPKREYKEILAKAQALLEAISKTGKAA